MKENGEIEGHGGDRKSSSHHENLKYADLGIDHNQSSRWQQAARIPDDAFERHLSETTAEGRQLTTNGVLRLTRKAEREADGDSEHQRLTLYQLIDQLNTAVKTVFDQCPEQYRQEFSRKLIDLGNEILETGTMRY
jgi:hypothetical protein